MLDVLLQCCRRLEPLGYKWPRGVEERKEVDRFHTSKVDFKDGTSEHIDAVIYATGYKHHYPFMQETLRHKGRYQHYHEELYKGVVWTKDGGNRLFYVGALNQIYTIPMFEAQALWTLKVILGGIALPKDNSTMGSHTAKWMDR